MERIKRVILCTMSLLVTLTSKVHLQASMNLMCEMYLYVFVFVTFSGLARSVTPEDVIKRKIVQGEYFNKFLNELSEKVIHQLLTHRYEYSNNTGQYNDCPACLW